MFSFSASGSRQQSQSNPWSKQAPFLQQGFQRAEDILNNPYQGSWQANQNDWQTRAMQGGFQHAGSAFDIGNLMQNTGAGMASGLPGAQGVYAQGMQDQFANPYESDQFGAIRGDSWGAPYQAASDHAFSNMMENVRRSDFGDAMGGSLAGHGTGAGADRYLQARQNAMGEGLRGWSDQDMGLRMQGLQSAENRANTWAGSQMQGQQQQFQNRQGSAANMAGFGMQGMDMMAGGWGMGQQGAQAQLGFGDRQYQLDQDQVIGGLNQYDSQMQNLLNAWNIWGGASFGGQTKGKTASAGVGFG